MRNSRFARSTLIALALTNAVAFLALEVTSTAFARGTAGASGAAGTAGSGSTGGGGANPIRALSVVTVDPPPRYRRHVPMPSRTSDTCWKATTVYDGAGNSLGAIPRQECYAQ